MKAYSLDLRERVLGALQKGTLTQPQIADTYEISLRTVETWARHWRETGRTGPKSYTSGPPRTLAACAALIRQTLAVQPDATLQELCTQVAAKTQVQGSVSMMCRELQHLNLPRKKSFARQSARNTARSKVAGGTSRQDRGHPAGHRRSSQIHR